MKIQNSKLKIQKPSPPSPLPEGEGGKLWGMRVRVYIIICIYLIGILFNYAFAQEKEAAKEEYLTKGEAVRLLSATDFMKEKIGALLSWTIGYDISKVSRVRLTPSINYIKAVPRKVPPDGRTILEIEASVDDPGGLGNIAGVRADLSSIGRLSNTMLVDNGLFGDKAAADGIYTLQTSISPKIDIGNKEVPVAVANKKGWLALAKTTLDVEKNPVIIEAVFAPDKVKADGRQVATLMVRIDNPGRTEDLRDVTVDLRAFGYKELIALRDDGKGGDAVAADGIFTVQFVVPDFVKARRYTIRIGASNLAAGYVSGDIFLEVYK